MKLLFILMLLTVGVFMSCGDDVKEVTCKNPCEQNAATRCKSSDTVEVCTDTSVCLQWIAKKCESTMPVCEDDEGEGAGRKASCVPSI